MFTVRAMSISHNVLEATLRNAHKQLSAAFVGTPEDAAKLEPGAAIEALRRVVMARDSFVAAVDKLDSPPEPQAGG